MDSSPGEWTLVTSLIGLNGATFNTIKGFMAICDTLIFLVLRKK